ncbi:glycosyltransferase family 39 protein [Natrinema salsiterrestre]|uniref:Glycosyltransferase family 39 protein n=1 Tax=Natrinema salsiterrestre TaxID=2950540 RepID=A0A9Q4L3I2_9EURY|nr:glycosyltransferase family 39 protein [Natrinema salsiterrestre]MDF9745842.1 glycosyltransferase family 39 protein [Natrinema salsiterrestre]
MVEPIRNRYVSTIIAHASVFIIALVINLVHWLVPSIRNGSLVYFTPPDTSKYLSICQTGPEHLGTLIYKIGFLVPFCLTEILPGHVGPAWVAVQILLVSLASVLVFDTARRVFDLRTALVAGLSFALLYDTFRWTRTVLSDILFVFILTLALWALVRFQQNPTRRTRLAVYGACLWLAVTRPFGAPIVAGWLLYDMVSFGRYERFDLVPSRRLSVGLFLLLGAVVLLSVENWFPLVRGLYAQGAVFSPPQNAPYPIQHEYAVVESSSSLMFILRNFEHIVIITFLRVGAFFIPVIEGAFQSEWKVWNTMWLTVLLVGSVVGCLRLYRQRIVLFQMWVTPLVMIVAVCAVTFVDASFRYRAPAGPVFALLFSYSVSGEQLAAVANRLPGVETD